MGVCTSLDELIRKGVTTRAVISNFPTLILVQLNVMLLLSKTIGRNWTIVQKMSTEISIFQHYQSVWTILMLCPVVERMLKT